MRNSSLRVNMTEILSNLQILYQNQQISAEEKNYVVSLLKSGLSGGTCDDAASYLLKIKNAVGPDFKDVVFDCIQLLEKGEKK